MSSYECKNAYITKYVTMVGCALYCFRWSLTIRGAHKALCVNSLCKAGYPLEYAYCVVQYIAHCNVYIALDVGWKYGSLMLTNIEKIIVCYKLLGMLQPVQKYTGHLQIT